MYTITFNNKRYQCRSDETVLEALLRQGVEVSFSCRKGSCHVCMLKCSAGEMSGDAQDGLRPVFIKNGFFLPCKCKPGDDLVISEIDRESLYSAAYVLKKEILSETVCRLLIESDTISDYKPGQFVNIGRPKDGLIRSYSVANHPGEDGYLELHVQRMENGELSNWIFDELQEYDEIDIQGPNGHCYYQPGHPEMPMLMVSTGTGLAPILGILRDAIRHNHTGHIHVYHEGRTGNDHYLDAYMRSLAEKHENINYYPCGLTMGTTEDVPADTAISIIHSSYYNFTDWMIYLAGSSRMVSEIYADVIAKGAMGNRVFSDAFDLKDLRQGSTAENTNTTKRITDHKNQASNTYHDTDYPEPDLEIWEALEQGKKLTKILSDFYTIVYDDPKLSPFFDNVTKQRSIEKVYLFLRQIFTGEKVYFGDRPRNAHHWMVISDELFDYREDIMVSCLRNNNIPEHLIKRWRAIEEIFRPDIVKNKPWNKVMGGIEIPVEGFEELVLDSGTLCDSCHQSVEAGTQVRYHVRLGSVYCPSCMSESKV